MTTFGAGAAANWLSNYQQVQPIVAPANIINNDAQVALGRVPAENATLMARMAEGILNNVARLNEADMVYKARLKEIEANEKANADTISANRKGAALRLAGQLLLPGGQGNPAAPDPTDLIRQSNALRADQANWRDYYLAPVARATAASSQLLGYGNGGGRRQSA